jgi:glucokinase
MSGAPGCIVAADFGGTKHAVGVITPGQPSWLAHRRAYSAPGAQAADDLRVVLGLCRELLGGRQPLACGISFGGPVDASRGHVLLSHHVPGWEDTPLQRLFEQELGAPAAVENDANVAALGEHRFGAGRGRSSLLYVTVSTGVGGGWILNNTIWHGADSMAGEIGHTVVDPAGPPCLCGKRGCVERIAAGPNIALRAREWLEAQPGEGQILRSLVGGKLEKITGRAVSQAAEAGDALAWRAMERSAWALGVALGSAANLINPELFVVGGGVSKAGGRFFEVIRRVARQTALPQVHFDIVPAALGDDAPLWGAVALARDLLAGVLE